MLDNNTLNFYASFILIVRLIEVTVAIGITPQAGRELSKVLINR